MKKFIQEVALTLAVTLAATLALGSASAFSETYRGIVVADEDSCAPYNRKADYPYPQSVEGVIIERMGGRIYGPYTDRTFDSRLDTHIEHIVAVKEAHDSGLCRADAATKRRFAQDILNLTLAAPAVNRGKSGKDVAEWLPNCNKCWFVYRTLQVRHRYGLTIDRVEADAAEAVLSQCGSVEMQMGGVACR